jgi:hypothetical protein
MRLQAGAKLHSLYAIQQQALATWPIACKHQCNALYLRVIFKAYKGFYCSFMPSLSCNNRYIARVYQACTFSCTFHTRKNTHTHTHTHISVIFFVYGHVLFETQILNTLGHTQPRREIVLLDFNTFLSPKLHFWSILVQIGQNLG